MKGKSRESNFIKHWVRIKLEGFRPERIISKAMASGITLRQVEYKDETEVYMSVPWEDYKRLKKMAGSKYRLTKAGEGGLRPAASKIRAAKKVFVGVALFFIVVYAQSLFVKDINIVGLKTIDESQIRQVLREEGLYEGAMKRFDCDAIETRLFQEFDSIVWARVAYEGTYVEVQLSESKQVSMAEGDQDKPCDIVSDQDCYIERILSYTGKSVVQKNDFVKKGQVLISGTIAIEHPSYELGKDDSDEHYVHASGKVVARVPYYFSFYMDKNDGKAEAEALLRQWIKENVPEKAQILNKDFHFDEKKNIIRVYGTIETRQQVGEEKEIVIDKHKRRTEEDTD